MKNYKNNFKIEKAIKELEGKINIRKNEMRYLINPLYLNYSTNPMMIPSVYLELNKKERKIVREIINEFDKVEGKHLSLLLKKIDNNDFKFIEILKNLKKNNNH